MTRKSTPTTRRTVLTGIGATLGSLSSAAVSAKQPSGFPPKGITKWSDPQPLGDGEFRSFVSRSSSGRPKFLGIHLSEGALDDLATPEELEESGRGIEIHGRWSKPYTVSLPDNAPAPFNYCGFAWNPQGHTPEGVYDAPHFDIHFYFNKPETIGSIGGGRIEDLPDSVKPEGYRLIEGGAIVPKMGAHLAPTDAPELNGGDFTNTLLWGAADVDEDDAYELNFIEPMLTTAYLRGLDGVDSQTIGQPDTYPQQPGWYPTTYTVRHLGNDGHAVVLTDFRER